MPATTFAVPLLPGTTDAWELAAVVGGERFHMKRPSSFLLVIGLMACLAAPATAFAQEPQPVRVPMRDGIELAGDLYLPEGPGPFPTLVTKTPYQRGGAGRAFVSHGYAVLKVSQRGRFDSEGIFVGGRPKLHTSGHRKCRTFVLT